MKYFEIHIDSKQDSIGLVANYQNYDYIPLISGIEITDIASVPIHYQLDMAIKSKKFSPENLEYLNLGGGGILIHNRAKKLFESLTKHHTMYKSEVEYHNKKLSGPYYTMNLETLYPVMDIEKSEVYYYATMKDRISSVHKLVLSAKKLSQIPKDEHLFRLQEFTPVTIIDEYGKNLIEEAGVVGVEFQELEIAE